MEERSELTGLDAPRYRVVAALLVAVLSYLLGTAPGAGTAAESAPAHRRTVPIECGGHDEHGEVVNPRAAAIDEAPVTADGLVEVPPVCGGYTAEGTFIGDL